MESPLISVLALSGYLLLTGNLLVGTVSMIVGYRIASELSVYGWSRFHKDFLVLARHGKPLPEPVLTWISGIKSDLDRNGANKK